ncbi:hypothetical protein HPP92_009361 [Vanilla planifolia]|uniref:WIBG Mago-binding domain-containing protein n=1 Tax=Vanilla planifolia TaxID=51239 RepID=A0A835RFJ5_VANPL|nr:hypothetical protein HPP92_009361 [Vanilla planifolia]
MGDEQSTRLLRTPKEGERILAPTRRPDGTLRKPIRIRAGYTPQDEIAIYQSKGTLMRKAAESLLTAGYDPALDEKPKARTAKKEEKKLHLQAAVAVTDKGKNLSEEAIERIVEMATSTDLLRLDASESVIEGIKNLYVSSSAETMESSKSGESPSSDINQRIRTLKKKIRLAEGQLNGDRQNVEPQEERMARIEGWLEEFRFLEDGRTNQTC